MAASTTATSGTIPGLHVAMFQQEINQQTYWIGCFVDGPHIQAITPLSVNRVLVEHVSLMYARVKGLPWNAQAQWGDEKIVTIAQSNQMCYLIAIKLSALPHLKNLFEIDSDSVAVLHRCERGVSEDADTVRAAVKSSVDQQGPVCFWEFSHLRIDLDKDWPQPEDPLSWGMKLLLLRRINEIMRNQQPGSHAGSSDRKNT